MKILCRGAFLGKLKFRRDTCLEMAGYLIKFDPRFHFRGMRQGPQHANMMISTVRVIFESRAKLDAFHSRVLETLGHEILSILI